MSRDLALKIIGAAIVIIALGGGAYWLSRPKPGSQPPPLANNSNPVATLTPSSSSTPTPPTSTPILPTKPATKPNPPTTNTTAYLLSSMHQTFDDEFNSFSQYLDKNGNVTCYPGGSGTWQTVYNFCSRTNPGNDEAEVYIDPQFISYLNSNAKIPTTAVSPFSVSNGVLRIEANPSDQAIQTAVGSWAQYTSGLITTQFSFSQTYGYFEIRAKLPAGAGLWPAFWLLPTDQSWPPEVDAMEAFGAPNADGEGGLTSIHYASHTTTEDASSSCGDWSSVNTDLSQNFHTYGVDIEPTGITYYFDGKAYATCPANPEADKPFYMLIDLAVGSSSSWPGAPQAANTWPAYMYVDYVRAYQHN